ncbi:hypothetical protein R3P38DRAFT_2780774 [Favolaschia claudopus]|uniref:Uncharacterized protein n=1 Tax=Favolaschia claudopus TaxID=2862362 RepID=A0AAW0B601_9AGAR
MRTDKPLESSGYFMPNRSLSATRVSTQFATSTTAPPSKRSTYLPSTPSQGDHLINSTPSPAYFDLIFRHLVTQEKFNFQITQLLTLNAPWRPFTMEAEWKGSSRLHYVLAGVENLAPDSSKRPRRPPINAALTSRFLPRHVLPSGVNADLERF